MAIFQTKNLVGLLIIAAGIVLLLGNLEVIEYTIGDMISFWPVILVYFGLKHLYKRETLIQILIGAVMTIVGAILITNNTGFIDVDLTMFWRMFWPTVIIIFGLTFFSGKNSTGSSHFAVLGGIDHTKNPWELNSGSYLAFMGGVDLDMRLADIKEDKTVLDFTAIMGGIDVRLPDNVDVECRGTCILGGAELLDQDTGGIFGTTSALKKADPSTLRPGETPKKIIIQARTFMGGVEVKIKK
ncbi:LiaF transmembrane domain-containing protein [Natranaerofaba carboxydovora]|uniref:LiaF transmembrane domain-containing protein n=1 Tax=Natranaerofaba carboxydovora TaxID=2742683 RepID=UPI001F14451F|nr:LiaF domain-containing protein [Natranaerofaba carboxydovora]UMZ72686.1 Cell wall-active antibiotics response 4TMS YvqF [Natranaerofaba carboxydovora]